MREVQPHLTTGKLRLVPRPPQYSCLIYVVYSDRAEDAVLQPALAGLRKSRCGADLAASAAAPAVTSILVARAKFR